MKIRTGFERLALDAAPGPCQSRPVKSCGPSGSQGLAFFCASNVDRDLRPAVSLAEVGQGVGQLAQLIGPLGDRRHAPGKDDLRDGIVELVMEEIQVAEGAAWKPALCESAISAHEALVRHPWACSEEPSEFEFGLDLILEGFERIRDAA
jgi:hypothetical protein